MSDTSSSDHDQRLKVLLKEFFEQFFQCFFPEWAKRFDFSDITWLDKEVFLDPPQGKKRQLDLVARLRIRPDAPPPLPGMTDLLVLVHVEVESGDSVQPLRPRMFQYYTQLRRESSLPVLPIGLYLRVGLEGIGWDSYEEYFWDRRVLCFEYAYVGLPALPAEEYASSEHLLGVALTSLMRTSAERRVELYADSLKRIALSQENDYRRHLLSECLEAYAELDEAQRQEFQALLNTEAYQEARPLMTTTYERGKIDANRGTALKQLKKKFNPLPAEIQKRVAELTPEQLDELLDNIILATSLKELKLEE